MTDLERRALLGDAEAQRECTENGIVLPCWRCGGGRSERISDKCVWATAPVVRQLREELAMVTAERDAAQRLLAEHSGVVGMKKVTTCFGCPLDKVLELVLAYRDGRLIIRQEKGKEAAP